MVSQTLSTSAAQRLAYVVKTTSGEAVVLDGVVGRTYSMVPMTRLTEAGRTRPIVFSPDGKRIAYVASKAGRWLVVVDGVEGKAFDRIGVGAPVFSPDSRRVAYIAEIAGKTMVVIDGIPGPLFDDIGQSRPKFTADSKHLVYSARRDNRGFIVVDRTEVGGSEFVGDPVYSESGRRLAYAVLKNDGNVDWWSVKLDGVAGRPYRHIGNNLVFSGDGRHFLYRGGDSLDYVVVDEVQGRGYGTIKENSYGFSKDGAHVAFVAGDGGREGEPFDDVTSFPEFARDGRVLYIAKRGARQYVGVDTTVTPFDQVSTAFITTAGRLVVVARQGARWNAIVDGAEGRPYPEPPGPFAVSPDGSRIAYASGRGSKRLVVADGIEGSLYDEVQNIGFAPGGQVVYTARRLGRYRVVADGVESPAYDEILSFPYADELQPGSLTMLARRGTKHLRAVVEWKR
ncbi:MAG: hypothetical protein ABI647_01610 [Gemmatimonadota bacterium]